MNGAGVGVVVTGVGMATPLGLGCGETWRALCAGASGIRPLPAEIGAGFACGRGGWIDLDPRPDAPTRTHAVALTAAREALAGAASGGAAPAVAAVVIGNNVVELARAGKACWLAGGTAPTWSEFGLATWLRTRLGIDGRAFGLASNCVAGLQAILLGTTWIAAGRCRAVLAGGADCAVTPEMLARFTLLHALAPTGAAGGCRPFDREHAGMLLGDGAGFLVLEDEGEARRRGARVLAHVAGFGMTADAHHLTRGAPDAGAKTAAVRAALGGAGVAPEEVDVVSAHGTGTVDNDVTEIRALRRALGAHAERVAITAAKGALGHALAASGAIETALAVRMLDDGWVPPVVGHRTPADACAVGGYVRTARALHPRVVLKNAFAFGGCNASVVLRTAAGGERQ